MRILEIFFSAASLLMGLLLRNLPAPGNIDSYISPRISIVLRKIALTVILTRAGLEIDPKVVHMMEFLNLFYTLTLHLFNSNYSASFGKNT